MGRITIAVTGGNGQLGRSFNLLAKLYPDFCFYFAAKNDCDLLNEEATRSFLTSVAPTYIINAAAYTAVDVAESDVDSAQQLNAGVPKRLALIAKELSAKLIHFSTDYVFDGLANIPYKEADTPSPQTVYGRTKEEGEQTILQTYATGCMILRTAWLYSPFGKNFFKTFVELLSQPGCRKVVVDQIGTPTSAIELAKAVLTIIQNDSFAPGIYHFSNQGVASWYDFAYAIGQKLRLPGKVVPCHTDEFPRPAKRPAYSVLDKTLFEETFNYRIPHWLESLDEVVKMNISNQ